jgi:hypothetical protein
MDYLALIDKLQSLPEDKQATVFDFVEFLHSRYQVSHHQEQNLTNSSLATLLKTPLLVNDFKPMSRKEANERKNYSSKP